MHRGRHDRALINRPCELDVRAVASSFDDIKYIDIDTQFMYMRRCDKQHTASNMERDAMGNLGGQKSSSNFIPCQYW